MFRGLARYRREFTETATRLCSPHKGTLATEDPINFHGRQQKQFLPQEESNNHWSYRDFLYQPSNQFFDEQPFDIGNDQYVWGNQSNQQLEKGGSVSKQGQLKQITQIATKSEAIPNNNTIDISQKISQWRNMGFIAEEKPVVQKIENENWGITRNASMCRKSEFSLEDMKFDNKINEQVLATVTKALNENNIFMEAGVFETSNISKKMVPKQKAKQIPIALSNAIPKGQISYIEEEFVNQFQIKRSKRPWFLSFHLEKTLVDCSIDAWNQKPYNVNAAQQAYLLRAKANAQAMIGYLKVQYKNDRSTIQFIPIKPQIVRYEYY